MTNLFMKITCFLIIVSTIFSNSCKIQTNNFEGIIKYSISVKSLDSTLKQSIDYYGDSVIVYFKDGHYKQEYPNAKNISETFYDNNSKRYYISYHGKDTLYYFDASRTTSKYLFTKIQKPDTILLGFNCKLASVTGQNVTRIFYYAPDLTVSAQSFKNHKYGGYDIFSQNTKSVYLAEITQYRSIIYYFIAYKIEKRKLDDSVFNLPNLPLKKYNQITN
ncbi:MAG: hypothetical protein WA816_15445 [Bacteroidales bacterium]